MVVITMLPHAELGLNDHREDAPHFNNTISSNILFWVYGQFNMQYPENIENFSKLFSEIWPLIGKSRKQNPEIIALEFLS